MPWKTDQYLEKLLPLALLLLQSGRLPCLEEPESHCRPQAGDHPALLRLSCLQLAVPRPGRRSPASCSCQSRRAAEPEPRARRPATPPPSSLLARSFRTDRYLWSERARGGWERSRRLLRHGGVQVLIGQISLSGDKRIQPPTRAGEPAAQRDRR